MERFEETNNQQEKIDNNREPESLIVTEDIRSYIYETAKWTKFLSIVGFIVTGLMVIVAFGVGSFVGNMSNMGPGGEVLAKMGGGFVTVLYLLLALFYFYPSFLMFKHANSAKQAVLYADQVSFSEAMRKMKSIFKFWGILTIVLISFYALILLFAIVAGVGTAAMGS